MRGNTAKINVAKAIQKAFGEDYIGEVDHKYYVWADDGAERVQIAITMTCPKTNIEPPTPVEQPTEPGAWNMAGLQNRQPAANVSPEEQKNISDMMKRLGLWTE